MIPLPVLEEIIDRSGIAPRIELLLPIGVRARQLLVRTLLLGMLIVLADHRPAHLTRVHQALTTPARGRPAAARRGRGLEARPAPAHLPADRAHLRPGRGRAGQGHPRRAALQPSQRICDDLLEASIPDEFKDASTSLAVDWTDVETFSRPPPRGTSDCADPEASWGHRSGGGPGQDSELFFGYYPSAATMMRDEHGPPVPELARRMTVCSCRHDPARALVPVLTAMPEARHPARRHPGRLRLRPPRRRRLGRPAPPVRRAAGPGPAPARPRPPRHPPRRHHRQRQPLLPGHPPHAAGTRPARPRRHPGPGRRPRPADRRDRPLQARPDHQRRRRRLPPGACPAAMGKIRCPLRPASMRLDRQPARDPHPARAPARLLPPADHHRPARTWPPKPGRNTTTPPRRTASPTPGAPAPSGPSPPPRTPPATTSPAAGPGSWAWPRSCSGSPACSPSATSAS